MNKFTVSYGLFYLFFIAASVHGSDIKEGEERSIYDTPQLAQELSMNDTIQLLSAFGIEVTPEEIKSGEFMTKFLEYQESYNDLTHNRLMQISNFENSHITSINSTLIDKQNNGKIIQSFYDLLINLSTEDERYLGRICRKIGKPACSSKPGPETLILTTKAGTHNKYYVNFLGSRAVFGPIFRL